MSTSTSTSSPSAGAVADARRTRPSALRRTGLAVAAVVASFPPTVWGVGTVVQMVTGQERDHLFHQLIGQGLLLSALWLAAVLPLAVAGWRGRRPGTGAGVLSLSVVVSAVVAAALAPGNGGAFVSGFAAVTVGLVWLALPLRPALRSAVGAAARRLDPVLAAVMAPLAVLHVQFAVAESALQRAMGDEHAAMSHNYDMAWVSIALALSGLAASVVPAARRAALWCALGSVAIGASRLLVTGEVAWSAAVVALGVAAAARVAYAGSTTRPGV